MLNVHVEKSAHCAHVLANEVSTWISRRWLFLALYENRVESNNNETGQSDIKT